MRQILALHALISFFEKGKKNLLHRIDKINKIYYATMKAKNKMHSKFLSFVEKIVLTLIKSTI